MGGKQRSNWTTGLGEFRKTSGIKNTLTVKDGGRINGEIRKSDWKCLRVTQQITLVLNSATDESLETMR